MGRSPRLIVPGFPHHIVQQGDADSRLMRRLSARQGRRVNRLEERIGTLWSGRFKSSVIDTDSYLLACLRYVELNPVRAGIVDQPEDYRWSSYAQRVHAICPRGRARSRNQFDTQGSGAQLTHRQRSLRRRNRTTNGYLGGKPRARTTNKISPAPFLRIQMATDKVRLVRCSGVDLGRHELLALRHCLRTAGVKRASARWLHG